MKSTVPPPSGLLGVFTLLTVVGATKDEYACHIPDDPETPISCLVADVKESGFRDWGSSTVGPHLYSEHAVRVGEDGIERYTSVTCDIEPVEGRKGKSFKASDPNKCDIGWLKGASRVYYVKEENDYFIDLPHGREDSHFQKLEPREACDLPFPKEGATYENDGPTGWEVDVKLGSKVFGSGILGREKRKVYVEFHRVSQGRRECVPNFGVVRNHQMMLGNMDDGRAFFFKHGSSHRPKKNGIFLTIFDKVFLLFNTSDREKNLNRRPPPSAPPLDYEEVMSQAAQVKRPLRNGNSTRLPIVEEPPPR
ncbi:hypothetical protein FOZ63_003942 [Perkinsus olseni]|uniref:Uncharacterized protein n=1 Tax=Perkinsus olseni TaxID=32597 RepID=A0A7J6RSV1_PEROL|nr:hypothetical protein FOZ63_003942 [Perkinsus olseni]